MLDFLNQQKAIEEPPGSIRPQVYLVQYLVHNYTELKLQHFKSMHHSALQIHFIQHK